MQSIKLGSKQSGEICIVAKSISWQEKPSIFKEKPSIFKYDRYNTYKSLYLEVDKETLKDIDAFYLSQKQGDEFEGIASNKEYYRVLGCKYFDGMFQQTMSYEELIQRWEFWSPYMNLPDDWSGVSFVVEVL